MFIKKYIVQHNEASILWLPFFRMAVSVFALFHFLSIQHDFNNFFSVSAYISPHIIASTLHGYAFSMYDVYAVINKYVQINFETIVFIFRMSFPVTLIFLCAGLFTRIAAFLSMLLHLIIMKSIEPYLYGVDYFTTIALFYCFIFPSSRYFSVDNLLFKNEKKELFKHTFYLGILQYHMCIVYFFSGFDKIQGITWRNGEAVWKAINMHNHSGLINLNWLAKTPFFLIAGWGAVILEIGYFLFINVKRTSIYWLIGICLMHLFIALSMGLYFFSSLMIILNLSAYYLPSILFEKSVLIRVGRMRDDYLNETKLV